jgi:hypothetical protein
MELTYFQQLTTFTYENNKLKSFFGSQKTQKRRKLTYNANGTISTMTVLIDPITLQETKVNLAY